MVAQHKILILDPYDHLTASYIPDLHERIRSFFRDVLRSPAHDQQSNYVISRLTMRDPRILILFGIDKDERVVAHAVAEILEIDDERICFVGQTQADVPGVLDKALFILDNWARSNNCTKVRTESIANRFSEASATRLLRRFGYKLVSYSFERDIGDGRKKNQDTSNSEARSDSASTK